MNRHTTRLARRGLLAAALALTSWLAVAPAADDPAPAADDAYDFVFLGESRPVLIRMHVRLDGKPVQAAWNDFMRHVFAYLDTNGDGVLSKDEAARAPALDDILSGGLNRGFGAFGFGGNSKRPTSADLDADGDGKVTPAELAAYYRKSGYIPFQIQAGPPPANPFLLSVLGNTRAEPSVSAVSEAVFRLLDKNQDGKLSAEELSAAPEALLRLDSDGDEILTAREVVPDVRAAPASPFGGMMMGGGGKRAKNSGNEQILPVPTPGTAPADLVRRLQQRYASLDAAELANFVKRPPDLEVMVRLGRRDGDAATVEAKASPLSGRVQARGHLLTLDLGRTVVDLTRSDANRPNAIADLLRQQYLAQFRQADKDKNGYLDEKEAEANGAFRGVFRAMDRDGDGKVYEKEVSEYLERLGELQARAKAGCVTLELKDQSRGLFDLLDTNRDGRLSVREMRGAAGLLKRLDGAGKGHLTRADIPRSYRLTLRRGPANTGSGAIADVVDLYTGGGKYEEYEAPTAGPAWFRKMDRNRDGDVSRREFLFSEELFREIDTDGDGLISAEEAERYDARLRKAK